MEKRGRRTPSEEHDTIRNADGYLGRCSPAGDWGNRFVPDLVVRSDLSQAGSGSVLAYNQRVGHWALRLAHVRRISRLGHELCCLVRVAKGTSSRGGWSGRTGSPCSLHDWRHWCRPLYDRPDADSSSIVQDRDDARDTWHQPASPLPFCGFVDQRKLGSTEPDVDIGTASVGLERLSTSGRLCFFCIVLSYVCLSIGHWGLRPRREYRVASAVRFLHLHAVGRNSRLAGHKVQSSIQRSRWPNNSPCRSQATPCRISRPRAWWPGGWSRISRE